MVRKSALIAGETAALWAVFKKAFPFMVMTVILTASLLFLGMMLSLKAVDFGNYAVRMGKINQLMTMYFVISSFLTAALICATAVITYVVSHNILAPILRVTKEIEAILNKDPNAPKEIAVRENDIYIQPLVSIINRLVR